MDVATIELDLEESTMSVIEGLLVDLYVKDLDETSQVIFHEKSHEDIAHALGEALVNAFFVDLLESAILK